MPDVFANGVSGLLAFQQSLATTGHNIANASTAGYTRQRLELQTRAPLQTANGYIGQGVLVAGVQRISNEFVNLRLQQLTSESQQADTYHGLANRVDKLLSDTQSSISPSLQNFFSALQSVANEPNSTAARTILLSNTQGLVNRFHAFDDSLNALNDEVNGRLQTLTGDINNLAANIAKLNETIARDTTQTNGASSDLLDQRQQLINELAAKIAINVVVQPDQSVSISVGKGQGLVTGAKVLPLAIKPDPNMPAQLQIAQATGGANGFVLLGEDLNGGELGGLMNFRRNVLAVAKNGLDNLATVFANTVNAQHRQGMDLSGVLGGDFFTAAHPRVLVNQNNTGNATVTATVKDVTALVASDYQLRFDGSQYTLTRLSDNASISGTGTLSMDGFELSLTGTVSTGDQFIIRPAGDGASELALTVSDPNKIAAALPVRSSALAANKGNATISPPTLVDASQAAILDKVQIRFKDPPSSYDVIDITKNTTLATGVVYDQNPIVHNGWKVELTGKPAAGDSFTIERNNAGSADNGNALALAGLQSRNLLGGSANYQQNYGQLAGQIGTISHQADLNNQAQTKLLQNAQTARDDIAGVNLDEEAVNLTRYQQAYQASAQLITVANTLFETLLSTVRN